MGKLYEIYKRNIYGVIGTLVFHILLVSVFLLADIERKGNFQEEELIIEFPELVAEPDIPEEEQQEQETQEAEESSPVSQTQSSSTNIASNRLAEKNNDFFDEDYLKEVEDAKKLVSDVNNQLAKEKVDFEDIKMPVRTNESENMESSGNSAYTGESNIVYYLEKRFHRSLPIPVYLTQRGGKIIVDITVNRQGKVISAEPRKTRGINDEQLYLYAKAAASRTVFNAAPDAPDPQQGTIHYTFVPQ